MCFTPFCFRAEVGAVLGQEAPSALSCWEGGRVGWGDRGFLQVCQSIPSSTGWVAMEVPVREQDPGPAALPPLVWLMNHSSS